MTIKKSYILSGINGFMAGVVASILGYGANQWQWWLILGAGITSYFIGRIAESK